jgi:hypothetical protein
MSGKNMKLLRKGAKKFHLPYTSLKDAFKNLDNEGKRKFLTKARINVSLP